MKKQLYGAMKHRVSDPIIVVPRRDNRGVIYVIKELEQIPFDTTILFKVSLRNNSNLADPGNDIALLAGYVQTYRVDGSAIDERPELWLWRDKFWLKARTENKAMLYHDKCYFIYEVEIPNKEDLLSTLHI